jgi:Histidine kinase-, DNA gyrase B-, and HSP90-like ATPase
MEQQLESTAPSGLKQQTEELVYAAAVLILSQDLYPRKLEVVREYIQNASDALDEYRSVAEYIGDRSEPLIRISIQGRSLLIFDNGIGMDEEEIDKLKRIAYSEKKSGEEAGYKGIGRLAGIAVADKLKISSTSYGSDRLYCFEFRAKDMREDISEKKKTGIQEPASQVISRHTEIKWIDIDPESHYTIVEIRDVSPSYQNLLDPDILMEYIGDIAPVDFAPVPDFSSGPLISEKLRRNVPDYSPKTMFLAKQNGERVRIYKPYRNEMVLAEPDFIEIQDPNDPNKLLAYCWFASKGQETLGKVRPSGRIFAVDDGDGVEQKRRFAGLVYKLFGFTIGDRSLPQRTLWTTALPRALWFTGEIHVIDKGVVPTTDRSDFVETQARDKLYAASRNRIPSKLIRLAQEISDNRQAYDVAARLRGKLDAYKTRLAQSAIDRADLKTIREDLREILETLNRRKAKCNDPEVGAFVKAVTDTAQELKDTLDDPKVLKRVMSVADIATELNMTSKARKVFEVIMETLARFYADNKEEYQRVAEEIYKALRRRY